MLRKHLPGVKAKTNQTHTADRGSYCISSNCVPCPLNPALSLLPFTLVFLNESGAGRKDCGKGQEESTKTRAIFLGNETSYRCYQPAQHEANRVLIPLRLP